MVRAANNGLSGVIDPYGRIVDAFGLDAVGALDAEISLASAAPRNFGSALLGTVGYLRGACSVDSVCGARFTAPRELTVDILGHHMRFGEEPGTH